MKLKKLNSNQTPYYKAISQQTLNSRIKLEKMLEETPIPTSELLRNLALYVLPTDFQRFLFLNDLYQQQIDVHGVIMEFGVRWGNNMSIFQALRSIYEPYNHNRKIYGFDTFTGFPSVHKHDGNDNIIQRGNLNVSENYEGYLEDLLTLKEKESPVSEVKKINLVKGNITKTLDKFFDDNPHTIVSFAYFDLDLYEPTKAALESIKGYVTKGTVLGFDELNNAAFPGETIALKEVFGLNKYQIRRSRFSLTQSYLVLD